MKQPSCSKDTTAKEERLLDSITHSDTTGEIGRAPSASESQKAMFLGVVEVRLLEEALECQEEQTRLDALALLCDNQRTTQPLVALETSLVRSFLPHNLNNQNPAFRQQLVALVKKVALLCEVSYFIYSCLAQLLSEMLSLADMDLKQFGKSKQFLCSPKEEFIVATLSNRPYVLLHFLAFLSIFTLNFD